MDTLISSNSIFNQLMSNVNSSKHTHPDHLCFEVFTLVNIFYFKNSANSLPFLSSENIWKCYLLMFHMVDG